MTRIIAGFAGSLTLAVPKSGTRPTSDRVREALFSALEARGLVDGARVLDLYAGSGALGLEAASRGAARVALVERAPRAAAICRANARALADAARRAGSQPPEVEVHPIAAETFASREGGSWDLALIDPPYDLTDDALAALLAALAPRLAPDAVVVVERSSRSSEPVWPRGLGPLRRASYGETLLWWAESEPDGSEPDGSEPASR